MNVLNCKGCGRLFNAVATERLCPECRKKLDEKFQEVKEYLEEHPNAGMNDISRDCDVSVGQIKRWIREERLTFSENSIEGSECENCGKLIKTGRFCDACKAKISNNLMSTINKEPQRKSNDNYRDTTNRMRYL